MKKDARRLNEEANRFSELAKTAALKAVLTDVNDMDCKGHKQREDESRRAREHFLRAETFRTAAAIVDGRGV